MEKFVCIHGHFYQPPRENPWLETVELQDSAWPYHDWNERITVECYAPNSTARILDGEGRISEITSNYSKMSFNFGPTLLAWMKEAMPEVHEAIVQADRLSRERFSGHGSALAQVYNHMILPLANQRDQRTQVLWGIKDFEYRFGRPPEGMWLSETAADTATLETLAEYGIKFTILSPYQASRVREIGKRNSKDVNGGHIDPTRPYFVKLPSGRKITVFFYDAPVSQAVAFEGLLNSGERFAHRILSAFSDQRRHDQLVHLATDGESYGHHHRHGEMALAYALKYIEEKEFARLTNYGEYLEKHAPAHEAQIHEKSAWSCVHGVGRWMRDCGCNSGGHPGWNQGWRTPLRQALDWLRDQVTPLFEQKAKELLREPWAARDDYISVILDRNDSNREAYFSRHVARALQDSEKVAVFKLMELQRHAMLMYTSCGWFFDEISGIESVQVVQYAARTMQLTQELFGQDLEPGFLNIFEGAKSNLAEHSDGRRIYSKFVKPAMIDWERATAHYAVSSVFAEYAEVVRLVSYCFDGQQRDVFTSGKTKLVLGRVKVVSEITQEQRLMTYGILYLGEHNLTGGVRGFRSPEAYEEMRGQLRETYERADFPETIRLIDRHFGEASYSLRSLFKDEQRRILNDILVSTREDLENRFKLVVERYGPLMKFLQSAGAPLPAALEMVTDFVLHSTIRKELASDPPNLERLASLIGEAQQRGTNVLDADISYAVKNRMEVMARCLVSDPSRVDLIHLLERIAALVMPLPLGLNLWKVQNTYWKMLQEVMPEFQKQASAGDGSATEWLDAFLALGKRLGFAVNHAEGQAAHEEAKLAPEGAPVPLS